MRKRSDGSVISTGQIHVPKHQAIPRSRIDANNRCALAVIALDAPFFHTIAKVDKCRATALIRTHAHASKSLPSIFSFFYLNQDKPVNLLKRPACVQFLHESVLNTTVRCQFGMLLWLGSLCKIKEKTFIFLRRMQNDTYLLCTEVCRGRTDSQSVGVVSVRLNTNLEIQPHRLTLMFRIDRSFLLRQRARETKCKKKIIKKSQQQEGNYTNSKERRGRLRLAGEKMSHIFLDSSCRFI